MDNTFLTPVGRIVQEFLWKPQTTNMEGKPLTNQDGTPRVQYYVGLAIPKNDPGLPAFFAKLQEVAAAEMPHHHTSQIFSWKYVDGDLPENANKEGFPGCYVLKLTNGFPVQVYSKGGESIITDPNALKRGYYARVYGNITGNKSNTRPGIYLNMSLVEFVAYGEEIASGPDGRTVFGSAPASTLPPGASTTPVSTGPPLAAPGAGARPPAPGLPPGPGAPPIAPNTAFTQGPPPPPPAPAGPQMTPLAKGVKYEDFIAQGWTDALLKQHGYMA